MKIGLLKNGSVGQGQKGSTFIKILVGSTILGVMFASVFTSLATRTEGLRLHKWADVTTDNTITPTYTETYYPLQEANNRGFTFNGTLTVGNATLTPPSTYDSSTMRLVTVQVSWMSGGKQCTRQMSTYVFQYGEQNHLISN